jgi:hypothetical protein
VEKKWTDHGHEFEPGYDDMMDYWRDAADIVKRYGTGSSVIRRCPRLDGTEVYWDPDKQAIVFVKDGKITNYYPATFTHWETQCTG